MKQEPILKALYYVIGICLLAIPVMFLWNFVCPELFGVKKLTYIGAVGINFLASILFGGNTLLRDSLKK